MEVRDSDMPDEAVWSSFFDPQKILGAFGLDKGVHDLVEFGCGYGTFTLATARMASGTVYSFDINPEMIRVVRQKCRRERVTNVRLIARDFVAKGTGLPSLQYPPSRRTCGTGEGVPPHPQAGRTPRRHPLEP